MQVHETTGGSSQRSWLARFALAGLALGVGTQTGTPVVTATAQPSTQPSTTFRTQTTLVELDVRVADREGDFVSDLAADDFEVLIDGTAQRIAAFDLVRMETDAPTAPPGDVATNDRDDQEGRVYVLVLDDLQTHPSRSETPSNEESEERCFATRTRAPLSAAVDLDAFAKNVTPNAIDQPQQRIEAHRALRQGADDHHGPLITDAVQHLAQGVAVVAARDTGVIC